MLDDSRTPVYDKKTDWIKPRADKGSQDWYFFVYGKNYKDFYKQYIGLMGKIPMIPRYTLGAWVTDLNFPYLGQKYTYDGQAYNESYMYNMVARFRKEHIPLDIFVLDYGWHKYGGDGSLDWSPIFSDAKAFLRKMHEDGIKVAPNEHPTGLFRQDSRVPDAVKKLHLPIPHQYVDISANWLFHIDPSNVGVKEEWFSPDHGEATGRHR